MAKTKTCPVCLKKKKIEKRICASCKREKARSTTWYRKKMVEAAKKQVRARDNMICQRCGKNGEYGWKMECSHVFSEGRHPGMSADPQNMKILCSQCHMWWHENPIQSAAWYKEKFPERYEYLLARSREDIKVDWKKEYALLEKGLALYNTV